MRIYCNNKLSLIVSFNLIFYIYPGYLLLKKHISIFYADI